MFICWILRALEYEAYLSTSKCWGSTEDDHLFIIVHYEGTDFYVDTSLTPPTFQFIIPLDFELESPLYKCSLWDVKFYKRRLSNGQFRYYMAFHINPETESRNCILPEIEPQMGVYNTFTLDYKSIYEMKDYWDYMFANEQLLTTNNLYIVQWIEGRLWRSMLNDNLWEETEGRKRRTTRLDGVEGVRKMAEEILGPNFSRQLLDRAFETWDEVRKPLRSMEEIDD